ncbi:MAG: undecaprenyldiphospho-muramoylpentapeptide beta-N-acetylglucosaminyltransferase, partial [bacterium]
MRLLIAGGGTGGHIYPGVAVARAWLRGGADNQVLFVGTARGLEARVLPREGLPFETIAAAGLIGRSIGQQIAAAARMAWGFIQSLGLVGRFRPNVVLGLGGYASAPAVMASWVRRRPVVLLEPNTVPGMANRFLSRLARRVAVSLPGAAAAFPAGKTVETGLPLREEFASAPPRGDGFWEGPLRVLIFGGSQGARAINEAVMEALPRLAEIPGGIRIVHQTGEADLERVRAAYKAAEAGAGAGADAAPYLHDMAERYRWAHLAVARAGAVTVAELGAAGLPSILIPLPSATHGHQEANARYMVDRGGARMILQAELSGERLAGSLAEMGKDRAALAAMAERARTTFETDPSEAVAALCRS